MARLNFSSPNEFDSRIPGSPRPDDLFKMLQLAMQEQGLQQQRAGYMPQPSASSADSSGTAPGGLLGRWLELQAAQQQPASYGEDRGQMPSAPAEPRFRLVRVSPAQPQVGIGTSDRHSYSDFGNGNPPDVMQTSDQGSGGSGRDTERPAPVIAGFAQIGRGLGRPIGPGPVPPVQIPELWQKIQKLLGLYGRLGHGRPTGDQAPDAAESAGGATILNQRKPPGGRKIEGDEDEPFDSEKFMAEYRRQVAERARKRGQFRRTPSSDPKDYCDDQHAKELQNCGKRMHEYADWDFYQACKDRAGERWVRCYDGDPDPSGLPEWSLEQEELYKNLWR